MAPAALEAAGSAPLRERKGAKKGNFKMSNFERSGQASSRASKTNIQTDFQKDGHSEAGSKGEEGAGGEEGAASVWLGVSGGAHLDNLASGIASGIASEIASALWREVGVVASELGCTMAAGWQWALALSSLSLSSLSPLSSLSLLSEPHLHLNSSASGPPVTSSPVIGQRVSGWQPNLKGGASPASVSGGGGLVEVAQSIYCPLHTPVLAWLRSGQPAPPSRQSESKGASEWGSVPDDEGGSEGDVSSLKGGVSLSDEGLALKVATLCAQLELPLETLIPLDAFVPPEPDAAAAFKDFKEVPAATDHAAPAAAAAAGAAAAAAAAAAAGAASFGSEADGAAGETGGGGGGGSRAVGGRRECVIRTIPFRQRHTFHTYLCHNKGHSKEGRK
ncbi:hypothetical protein T492DRAFT_512194 [Pavlovales sp. CCMP2436]|nr:hypothetical protein T492DRAFT_512194 [Pavlovales sp. CCMP2436]